jgi:hypothetical protein
MRPNEILKTEGKRCVSWKSKGKKNPYYLFSSGGNVEINRWNSCKMDKKKAAFAALKLIF